MGISEYQRYGLTRSRLCFRKISLTAEGMEIAGARARKKAEVDSSDTGPGTVGAY